MQNISFELINRFRHGTDRDVIGPAVQPSDEWFIDGFETYTWYRALGHQVRPLNILELGVRFGYAGIAMLRGAAEAGIRPAYVGIDSEHDGIKSNSIALANLLPFSSVTEIIPENTQNVYLVGQQLNRIGLRYDLIHVDGDHSPEGIDSELTIAYRWIAPGGCILVDDMDVQHVREAADQFCSLYGFKPILLPTHHQLYVIPV